MDGGGCDRCDRRTGEAKRLASSIEDTHVFIPRLSPVSEGSWSVIATAGLPRLLLTGMEKVREIEGMACLKS